MTLKAFFEVNFVKNVSRRQQKHEKLPSMQRVKHQTISRELSKSLDKKNMRNAVMYRKVCTSSLVNLSTSFFGSAVASGLGVIPRVS